MVPVTAEREAEPRILLVVAARRDVDVSPSEQVAAPRGAACVDRVLDGVGPAPDALERQTRLAVRARAQRAAADNREAHAGRRGRRCACWETNQIANRRSGVISRGRPDRGASTRPASPWWV